MLANFFGESMFYIKKKVHIRVIYARLYAEIILSDRNVE